MGSLSKAHARNRIPRGTPNRDPLRLVIGRQPLDLSLGVREGSMGEEVLECLHLQNARQDFIGETVAVIGKSRRRCWRCGKAGLLRRFVGLALLAHEVPSAMGVTDG